MRRGLFMIKVQFKQIIKFQCGNKERGKNKK